jgi:hypothetical protein
LFRGIVKICFKKIVFTCTMIQLAISVAVAMAITAAVMDRGSKRQRNKRRKKRLENGKWPSGGRVKFKWTLENL